MRRLEAYGNVLEGAKKWAGGRGVCRLLLGPNKVEAQREAELVRITADACDLRFSDVEDPESTPENYRLMFLLNGTKAQMIEFASIMISLTASPSAR